MNDCFHLKGIRLLTTGKCVGGEEPFYASISIVIPDLNSTVKCSVKTVIFSMSFLTRASSNSVMSVVIATIKVDQSAHEKVYH